MKRWLSVLLFGISLITGGCSSLSIGRVTLSDPQASQVHNQGTIILLQEPEQVFSQSFTMHNSGLTSVTFWVSRTNESELSGRLFVEVFAGGEAEPFYQGQFPAQAIEQNTPLRIDFAPREETPEEIYTMRFTTDGAAFEILGRTDDIYAEGVAALDMIPLNADMAFRTTYAYSYATLKSDLSSLRNWAELALPFFVVLFLPGWLLLELSGLVRRFDVWENAALAAAGSLALLPVIMIWTSLLTLPWRTNGLWIAALVAVVILAGLLYRRKKAFTLHLPSRTDLAMLIILLLSFFLRVVMVRDMIAPAWVDSVHHALLGNLIAKAGAFPSSYLPYFELDPTEYHPGFHTSLAALLLLSEDDPAQVLLIFGQVLNVLAILSAYLFTTALTKDKRAGVVAALAVGLFSPMPAYYTSWGRYTQLAGMVILPAPFALWLRTLQVKNHEDPEWVYPFISGIIAGGLFLVHYRVAAFLALLLFVTGLAFLWRNLRAVSRLALFTIMPSLLFVFPWLIPALKNAILPAASKPAAPGIKFMADFAYGHLTAASGEHLLWLAVAAVPLALWQRQRFALYLPAWVGLMLALANLSALGLPGGGMVNNTTVAISLYLPVAALAGYFLSQLIALLEKHIPKNFHALGGWLLVLGTLCVGLLGARSLVTILNPDLYLVRQADLRAIEWVKENISQEATILVNPFLWGYGVYAGSDGGYWISSIAGQPTLPPPVIHDLEGSDLSQKRNSLSEQVIALSKQPSELSTLLTAEGIEFIYLGARGGVLSPTLLIQSGLFKMLYANDGVWIFKVNNLLIP